MAVAKKKLVLIGLLIVAGVLAIIKFVLMKPSPSEKEEMTTGTTETMPTTGNTTQSTAETPVVNNMGGEKTASVTTHYNNPGGGDDVSFTIVVDGNGVITEAKTGVLAKNPTSKMRQESFAAALPAVLVGKKLSEVTNIDRVGGSSLTTNSFNSVLPQLRGEI